MPAVSIKINIQIRTIETIPAMGTTDLAKFLAHFRAATIANKNALLVNFLSIFQ
jgi:hypothetical protein